MEKLKTINLKEGTKLFFPNSWTIIYQCDPTEIEFVYLLWKNGKNSVPLVIGCKTAKDPHELEFISDCIS